MWYKGQDIVSIINQPDGVFKEGELFVVQKVRKCPCGCKTNQIYVGLSSDTQYKLCVHSNKEYFEKRGSVFWHNELFFKPLDEMVDISELVEVINNQPFLIAKV